LGGGGWDELFKTVLHKKGSGQPWWGWHVRFVPITTRYVKIAWGPGLLFLLAF